MSEQQKLLLEVQKAIRINTANIKAATVNATMCEVNAKTYERNMIELDRLHKIKLNNIQLQIDRYIDNLKDMHKRLDELLAEKEALHIELKEASHYGEILCEFCGKYFTSQGISRHRNTCISKPENRIVEEHKVEISDVGDDIEAKKAELEALMRQLNNIKAKKT
jgi:hypothetical protein